MYSRAYSNAAKSWTLFESVIQYVTFWQRLHVKLLLGDRTCVTFMQDPYCSLSVLSYNRKYSNLLSTFVITRISNRDCLVRLYFWTPFTYRIECANCYANLFCITLSKENNKKKLTRVHNASMILVTNFDLVHRLRKLWGKIYSLTTNKLQLFNYFKSTFLAQNKSITIIF